MTFDLNKAIQFIFMIRLHSWNEYLIIIIRQVIIIISITNQQLIKKINSTADTGWNKQYDILQKILLTEKWVLKMTIELR